MARIAWFNCFSGIAGDMALGALIDAGADVAAVVDACGALDVDGWELVCEPVLRAGIAATKAHVITQESDVIRTAGDIDAMIAAAALAPRVRDRARRTFRVLAEVEGKLHRIVPEHVHFHEVGAVDSIVDIVGTCAALEALGIDRVCAGPVAVGRGTVRAAHGVLPNPAPAVAELLRGAPVVGVDTPLELTTPTGAALLAALAETWGPLPPMTVETTGFGAGSRDIDGRVNATQVIVGAPVPALDAGQPIVLLETNLDDVTGETLAYATQALLGAGALDVWLTPVLMKKGRPGHVISVLCDRALAGDLAALLAKETGSFGVRAQRYERWPASRELTEVDLDGQRIRLKVSPGRAKVEHDDAARAARATGRPLRDVVRDAESHHAHHDHPHPH